MYQISDKDWQIENLRKSICLCLKYKNHKWKGAKQIEIKSLHTHIDIVSVKRA